jgi:hypothetical protein
LIDLFQVLIYLTGGAGRGGGRGGEASGDVDANENLVLSFLVENSCNWAGAFL